MRNDKKFKSQNNKVNKVINAQNKKKEEKKDKEVNNINLEMNQGVKITVSNKLLEMNITDPDARKQHNKYASSVKKEKETNAINKCPKCGGDLVERNGNWIVKNISKFRF